VWGVCVCVGVRVCVCVCMCVCLCVRTYVVVHVCVCARAHALLDIHALLLVCVCRCRRAQMEEWLRYARDVAAHGRPTEVAVTCGTTLARLAGAKAEAAAVNYTPTCEDALELRMAPVEELTGFLGPRCNVWDAAARAAAAAAAAATAAAAAAARLGVFIDSVILPDCAEAVRSLISMFARAPASAQLQYRATRDGKTRENFAACIPVVGGAQNFRVGLTSYNNVSVVGAGIDMLLVIKDTHGSIFGCFVTRHASGPGLRGGMMDGGSGGDRGGGWEPVVFDPAQSTAGVKFGAGNSTAQSDSWLRAVVGAVWEHGIYELRWQFTAGSTTVFGVMGVPATAGATTTYNSKDVWTQYTPSNTSCLDSGKNCAPGAPWAKVDTGDAVVLRVDMDAGTFEYSVKGVSVGKLPFDLKGRRVAPVFFSSASTVRLDGVRHTQHYGAAPGTFLFCLHSVRNPAIPPYKMALVAETSACVHTQGCGLHIGQGPADLTMCASLDRVTMNVAGGAAGFVPGQFGPYVSAAADVATAEVEAFAVTF
jgi:hypothetical protein